MTEYKYADRISNMKDTAMYMRGFFDNMNDPEMRSFGGGAPGRSVLPMKYMSKIANDLFSEEGKGIEAFQYSETFGLEDLRRAICDYLLIPTGVQAGPENIQIVSGGMETIYLVSQLFLQKGSVVLTEDPTFVHAVETFQMFQAEIVPCRCDEQGLIPEDVEQKIQQYDPKLIYVTPTFANPTGRSLPVERRKKLAELAGKYNVMILEDDPYRDVRYDGDPLPAIRSFDKTGNVIMACSFSKIFAPGSRIEQEAALLNGLEIGEIRIASYSSFAIEWVAKVMAEFSREHPGISIDVQEIYNYYEAEEMLKNEECDIAFCRYRENYGLYGEPLVDDRYTITMSTDDPFAANSCITMDQLHQRKVLGSKNGLTDMDEQDYPEMKKLEEEAMYSTSMDEMLYSMVREGIGVMFSTELMAPASRSEGIVSLPIYPDHYRTLGYYVKDPARLSSAAAAFIEATKRIVNA